MKSWLISRWKRMIFNHCSKKNYWPFEWFSKSSAIRSYPFSLGVLDVSQKAIALHRISPPLFVQSWLKKFIPWFCVPLSEQYHLIRNGEALMYNDSMIILHSLCQIRRKSQFKWLWAFPTAWQTFADSFPSLVKSLFCTDRIESIEWQDLEQRQRIDDRFEIHILRWELSDLLSSHQSFLLEVELRQCVFCKGSL